MDSSFVNNIFTDLKHSSLIMRNLYQLKQFQILLAMKNENNKNYGQVERNFHHDDTITETHNDASVKDLFDNDKHTHQEDDLQYKDEELHDVNHETNDFNRNENIPNEERVIDEDDLSTNDNPERNEENLDQEIEKDGDLDNNENEKLEENDEHFHEIHPRE